jgi:hypothetical protein
VAARGGRAAAGDAGDWIPPLRVVWELLFLIALLIKLCCVVERESYISCSPGLADVYRSPAFRTYHFIRLNKAPQCLRELLTALRTLANEAVKKLVEIAFGHGDPCRDCRIQK